MSKMCVHAMEYDSAIKRNEAATQAVAWVNREDITPREDATPQRPRIR